MRIGFVLALCVSLGCSSGEERAPVREREGMRVIEPGAAPRRALRYELGGELERTGVECEIHASTGDEDRTTRFSLELETSSRAVAGRSTFDQRIRITDAEADPDEDPQQARALAALVGATFSARTSDRGWYDERTVPEVEGRDPVVTASRDAIAEMVLDAIPLPEEEVGVGAAWEASAEREGARQRSRYELVRFEGEHAVRLRVRARQDAPGLRSEGHAELVVDLRRAHPEGETTHERTRTVETADRAIEVRQRVRIRVGPR